MKKVDSTDHIDSINEEGRDKSVMKDRFERRIKYLRVSLTDRCNFKCTYCRPETAESMCHGDLLTFEEVLKVVTLMVGLGINKVRLTGGEPLVRKNADRLVKMIADIDGIDDLAMTTNAVFLDRYARPLKEAGLDRVNISLDTLDPKRFKELTCGGELKEVLRGIDAAVEAGLTPLKLNTVVMRGFNDLELPAIIDFAAKRNFTVRFIEFMPMSNGLDWEKSYISTEEILKRPEVRERLQLDATPEQINTASLYIPLKEGNGEVGLITPMSKRFCDICNRLRLTADGRLRSCLPTDKDVDIKEALRSGASDDELIELVRRAVLLKPEVGEYNYSETGHDKSMVEIGG
ncbi:MAG: GTP 3',8-cyclase MoaA [Thermodesulfobacteriota bacterium]